MHWAIASFNSLNQSVCEQNETIVEEEERQPYLLMKKNESNSCITIPVGETATRTTDASGAVILKARLSKSKQTII